MHLIELLKDWPCTIRGRWREVTIETVTEHSDRVTDGSLFVARKGLRYDGIESAEKAVTKGASAIVVDRSIPKELDAFLTLHEVPIVTVPDCNYFLSYSSAQLAGAPSEEITVIAVTGTNGKTTVTHFAGQLLQHLGVKTAVIGTTGCFIDGKKVDMEIPPLTTPPAEYLHPLLKKCAEQGVTHVALEASSLGLAMERLAHCRVSIGVFLNVGTDHFEEHGGRDSYIEAKKKLSVLSDVLLVNSEDAECLHIGNEAGKPFQLFGRSIGAGYMPSGELLETLPAGEHNRLNAMAAASVVCMLGYPEREVFAAFRSLTLPEGRMQRLAYHKRQVFVDYAHSPDAMEAVLQAMASLRTKKVICVFGCGGDRDKEKRPLMGRVAELYSDIVIITSDNPRHEDPSAIARHILEGMEKPENAVIELDRKAAIQQAISLSQTNDIILIAGKGHETYQTISGETVKFSDVAEVLNAFQKLETF